MRKLGQFDDICDEIGILDDYEYRLHLFLLSYYLIRISIDTLEVILKEKDQE